MALSDRRPDQFVGSIAQRLYEKWKDSIGFAPRQASAMAAAIDTGRRPEDDECQSLLYANGTASESARAVRIHRTLESLANPRGKDALPLESALYAHHILYEGGALYDGMAAGEQGLHEGIGRLAKAICFCLWRDLGEGPGKVSPQVVYGLVLKPARVANDAKLANKRSEEQLRDEVWSFVEYAYRHSRFAVDEDKRQQEEVERDAALQEENFQAEQDAHATMLKERVREWI